jgi:hypothetical protein
VAAGRRSLVVLPLDSDYALPQAAAAIKAVLGALRDAGLRDAVGLGLLSMLGFESTCEHLEVGAHRGMGTPPWPGLRAAEHCCCLWPGPPPPPPQPTRSLPPCTTPRLRALAATSLTSWSATGEPPPGLYPAAGAGPRLRAGVAPPASPSKSPLPPSHRHPSIPAPPSHRAQRRRRVAARPGRPLGC